MSPHNMSDMTLLEALRQWVATSFTARGSDSETRRQPTPDPRYYTETFQWTDRAITFEYDGRNEDRRILNLAISKPPTPNP